MPQMAPIFWMNLLILLTLSMLLMMNLIYFLKSKKQSNKSPLSMSTKISSNKNWLW